LFFTCVYYVYKGTPKIEKIILNRCYEISTVQGSDPASGAGQAQETMPFVLQLVTKK